MLRLYDLPRSAENARMLDGLSAIEFVPANACLPGNPFPTFVGFLGVLAVVVILLCRATWRPAAPLRLARRRTWGQAITSAWRMYVTRWRLFLSIGSRIALGPMTLAGRMRAE